MTNPATTAFDYFSRRSREGKYRLFTESFPLAGDEKILDIGGEVGEQTAMLMDLHPSKRHITVVNIDIQHLETVRETYSDITVVVADARRLPFANDRFSIIYSNAVIEHVGTIEDQQMMADEVMRVGKRWFVTTPNRWYPFEFHLRMPLVNWLPHDLMVKAARICSFNHVQGRYQTGLDPDFRLLSVRQMRHLFRGSRIIAQRITFWPETILAIGADQG